MSCLKKLIFFSLFFVLFPQLAHSQVVNETLRKADELYKKHNFEESGKLFEEILHQNVPHSSKIFLKLASIYEQQNDISKELYYLNLAYEKQPNEAILKRMSQIADDHELKGYELNDLNFFVMLYKEYAHYLFALLVVLGCYIFGVLIYKRLKNEFIPFKQKLGLLLFIVGSVLLINLPDSYQSAIVNQDKVFLRSEPSAAAKVVDIIDKGHRLNVLSSDDIWYRVLWDNQLMYIRKQNVWVID